MADPDGAALRLMADKLAIRELLERYADAVIRNDAAAWQATWSERGAEWHIGGAVIEGAEAIAARWRSRMAEFDWVIFRVSIGAIELDGDEAAARSYTTEILAERGLPRREVLGRYDDRLGRTAGGWRFVRRTFSVIAR